jgi:meso-butanediol dehydrogenase/(S,S)-butanediol dehydrogenase/diacetyl reductase
MTDLTDSVVFVTGGGKGIGRAVALAFARAGADVAVCGRDTGALDETACAIEALGRRALAVPADVTDEYQVNGAVAHVVDTFSRIDVLVNNAGRFLVKPFVETTAEDWDAVHAVNVRGMFLVCRAVVPYMIERGSGHIFNVSSVGGRRAMKHATAYCASKHGVVGFSRALARELKPHGIKVQIVYPYMVDSAGRVDWAAEDPKRTKWITPEEFAAVIVENARRPYRVLVEEIVFEPTIDTKGAGE